MGAAEERNRPGVDPATLWTDRGLQQDATVDEVLLQLPRAARAALAALLLAFLIQFAFASHSAAAEPGGKHVFDALHSLTGGTLASPVDSVPDPPPNHPPAEFAEPCGVAVDSEGYVYVSVLGSSGTGEDGRIDIFNAAGEFLREIKNGFGPCDVAVDSAGTVYVRQVFGNDVVAYTPNAYPPAPSVDYGSSFVVDSAFAAAGLAVNPADDHLLVVHPTAVHEFSSAAEGNTLLKSEIGEGTLASAKGVAIDGTTGDIFVGSQATASSQTPSVIFIFDSSSVLKGAITGSDTPAEKFASDSGKLYPGIDEETGEVFVADGVGAKLVYRFVPANGGGYEYLADPELESHSYSAAAALRIAVANLEGGEPTAHYVYVASPSKQPGHLYAFGPEPETGVPIVSDTSVSGVTATEAILSAEINPHGFPTNYQFQYVDDNSFQETGFDDAPAVPVPAESIGGGSLQVSVSQPVTGLSPGTLYHFRVIANNCGPENPSECETEGEREEEGTGPEIAHSFATFSLPPVQGSCPNASLRVGPAALLPDCRAYEIVSPLDPGGHNVSSIALGALAGGFGTLLASPNGESVSFQSEAGPFPGVVNNGFNDRYESRRGPTGWVTTFQAPTGAQMQIPSPGGLSTDHGYSFWRTGGGKGTPDAGSLVINNTETEYLRLPDGSFELLGSGDLAIEPEAGGRWISANGSHAIFTSPVQLEVGAPQSGIEGIYDRTADGALHVISLLPGDLTPGAGTSVAYQGVSADGSTVAFKVTEAGIATLYLRIGDSETVPVASGAIEFGGLSADGDRLTYVKGGDIFSFEATSQATVPVGSGGDSTIVNVSADGSHIYFVSAQASKENLYVWDANTEIATFIATLDELDVIGEPVAVSATNVHGLGLWTHAVVSPNQRQFAGPANDPSRTSPDGRYFVFESHADLTGEEAGGTSQVFRYDAATGDLLCVSCDPTQAAAASGGGRLQTVNAEDQKSPINSFALIQNVTDDGRMVFFESEQQLVATDANAVRDVYEWEAVGTGGCLRAGGCISLISSGRGSQASYLYSVAADGRDVFFTTSDTLVPGAAGGAPAIYDARINGGFPAPLPLPECGLDNCQAPGPPPATSAIAPASAGVAGKGNVRQGKTCRKNQRRIVRNGKVRCVKKKRHGGGKHKVPKSHKQGGSK